MRGAHYPLTFGNQKVASGKLQIETTDGQHLAIWLSDTKCYRVDMVKTDATYFELVAYPKLSDNGFASWLHWSVVCPVADNARGRDARNFEVR